MVVAKGVGSVQFDIVCKRVVEQGGVLVTALRQRTDIIATKLEYKNLLTQLHLTDFKAYPNLRLHTLEWLTESLKQGTCLAKSEFRLYGLSDNSTSPSPISTLAAQPPSPFKVSLQNNREVGSSSVTETSASSFLSWDCLSEDEKTKKEESPRRRSSCVQSPPDTPTSSCNSAQEYKLPPTPHTPLSTTSKSSLSLQLPNSPCASSSASSSSSSSLSSSSSSSSTHFSLVYESPLSKTSGAANSATTPTKLATKPLLFSPLRLQTASPSGTTIGEEHADLPRSPSLSPTLESAKSPGRILSSSDTEDDPLPFDLDGSDSDQPPIPCSLNPSMLSHESGKPKSGMQSSPKKETTSAVSYIPKRRRLNANAFACQRSPSVNQNEHITRALDKLAETYKNSGDKWRLLAYTKAASAIKCYPKTINSVHELKSIPSVGESIFKKVAEIIETGALRRLEEISNNPQEITVNLFSKIFGAGPESCQKWYTQGFRTYEDLRTKASLSTIQAIGLKYVNEFEERIPRDEVTRIEHTVRQVLDTINPDLALVTCGSYRRGAPTCGDVDILISDKSGGTTDGILLALVSALHQSGFLTDDLVQVLEKSDKYMGVCQLPGSLHRRIDLKVFPVENWACALLYFTGSGYFNRSMRLFARKKGYSLSEHSLVKRWGAPRNGFKGDPIPVSTEYEIFQLLGLQYKTPEERDI
ncbi:DNA polymerase lambda [Pelomyxa schiedti]|nr:DNA polymerase lambda [Pelomyxa schiedti]